MKIAELNKLITKELKKATPNVVFGIGAGTPYPYIVFTTDYRYMENGYRVALEINVYDKKTNAKTVIDIANKVQKQFNGAIYADENFSFNADVNALSIVPEPNKDIQRIRILYDILLVE